MNMLVTQVLCFHFAEIRVCWLHCTEINNGHAGGQHIRAAVTPTDPSFPVLTDHVQYTCVAVTPTDPSFPVLTDHVQYTRVAVTDTDPSFPVLTDHD